MAGCSMLETQVLSHIAQATIHVKQLGTIDNHANKEAVIFARCRDFHLFQMINIFRSISAISFQSCLTPLL